MPHNERTATIAVTLAWVLALVTGLTPAFALDPATDFELVRSTPSPTGSSCCAR
jgi:hypothetical protein